MVGGLASLSLLLASGHLIGSAAKGLTYSDVADIPYRKVGLLLGCSRNLSNHKPNLYFAYRVAAATQLFRADKVSYIIVSGDNHVAGYDEASDMKQALVGDGVPADRIYCDYAGFRTLDSVVRAREVFGQTHVTVISQEFHNQRAIYIAQHRGIDAVGFNARDVVGANSVRTRLREYLARVRTVLDVYLLRTSPHFLGPRIEVGVDALEDGKPERSL